MGPGARGLSPEQLERFRLGLRRRSPRQGLLERGLRFAIRAACRACGWRVSIVSAPLPVHGGRPPGAGCIVAAAPHRAWIDPFLLLAAWPPDAARLAWIADGPMATRSAWRRVILPRVGVVPISPTAGGPRAYAGLSSEALAAGAAVAIFPEKGPPSPPERTRTVAPTFAYLAFHAGAPVVPVVLAGTHHIVRGSAFSVDILPALDARPPDPDPFSPAGRRAADDLTVRYREAVAAILPTRTAEADASRPARDRWGWLATLFR
jgi:1-acyl-sn-glycerol-3-phosphate acyltransferase